MFENVVGVLDQIDPAKLNSVLSALADGVRGKGDRIGQATTDANQVLLALNPRSETVRADWQALRDFSDTYSVAAQDILATLNAASTTSVTLTKHCRRAGCVAARHNRALQQRYQPARAQSGEPDQGHQRARADDQPAATSTTRTTPACWSAPSTCWTTEVTKRPAAMGDRSFCDAALPALPPVFLGDDPYHYPQNLPVVGAKGGPGGKPGCGSLPDVKENWPVRQLVTNTGFGTGVDWRPNPGIAFPAYANYLPVTRAVPEPPSIRNLFGGPAPGPIPYPGAPAYGADLYAPDGTPLWPGLPPAPPPGAPRDPGATPGSEPFVVPRRRNNNRHRCRRFRYRSTPRHRRDRDLRTRPSDTTTEKGKPR